MARKSLLSVARAAGGGRADGLRRGDGNVAIVFALLLVPILGAVGLAIDSLRAYQLEDELQQALDAAGLAAGRVADAAGLTAEAQQVFDANFASAGTYATVGPLAITVDESEGTIAIAADATMPTVFMRLFGSEQTNVRRATTINREVRQMELVLVMDNTGSMVGQPIADEIIGAKMLIDNVYGAQDSHDNLLVGLVPFTATVNIGSSRRDWLLAGDPVFGSPSPFDASPQKWKGCVMARPTPHDRTDDPPSVRKFSSFLYPQDVDNVYPPLKERVSDKNGGTGPNLGCGSPAILSLTPEKSKVVAEIDKMGAWHRGGTTSNLGLVWGWRVLSPRWRGLWGGNTPADRPLDYNTVNSDKVIVLLTDGNNEVYDWPDHTPNSGKGPRGSDMTAYGRLLDMGVSSIAAGNDLLDARMATLCTDIKREGIIIYAITFGAKPNAQTKLLFQTCATTPDYYFHAPDGATMKAVFKKVGRQLGNLRISR